VTQLNSGRRQEVLEDAARRPRGNLKRLSVRDLLGLWGAKRRGYWVVDRIERDLAKAGLITDPPFTKVWIDTPIDLIPVEQSPGTSDGPSSLRVFKSEPHEEEANVEVGLQVRSLKSASAGITDVGPDTDLLFAQSLMLRHDYSQLAVLSSPRDLRGAISWESIAQARLKHDSPRTSDCIIRAQSVRLDDDLLPLIPLINDSGFVFVLADDKTVTGIVTPSDVTTEFQQIARPFFLMGEIERRLRQGLARRFTTEELAEMVDPSDESREVESVDDLTLGEYVRVLENPDRWKRMDWPADRRVFMTALREVREVRNEIIHFSPDPLEEERVEALRLFIRWLRFVEE
jgi:predicted transcriptional regulator